MDAPGVVPQVLRVQTVLIPTANVHSYTTMARTSLGQSQDVAIMLYCLAQLRLRPHQPGHSRAHDKELGPQASEICNAFESCRQVILLNEVMHTFTRRPAAVRHGQEVAIVKRTILPRAPVA